MTNTFYDTLASIKGKSSDFGTLDERAVEIGVVLPLLRQVGWDTDNVSEIYPQYGLADGSKVDYDLQIDGESRVLIEVKRWAHELNDGHEEQLADYCRLAKPKLAVLTSGRNWRLYLPPTRGKSTPLSFSTLTSLQCNRRKQSDHFSIFLARNNMVGFGPTVAAAGRRYRESQAYLGFRKSFTEDWNRLSYDKNDRQERLGEATF